MLVHSFALTALAAAVLFILTSLKEEYALGRLQVQSSACAALAKPLDNPECRKAYAEGNSSEISSDRSRFLNAVVIFALLTFVAIVHVYSIVFVLKRLKRSPPRVGLRA